MSGAGDWHRPTTPFWRRPSPGCVYGSSGWPARAQPDRRRGAAALGSAEHQAARQASPSLRDRILLRRSSDPGSGRWSALAGSRCCSARAAEASPRHRSRGARAMAAAEAVLRLRRCGVAQRFGLSRSLRADVLLLCAAVELDTASEPSAPAPRTIRPAPIRLRAGAHPVRRPGLEALSPERPLRYFRCSRSTIPAPNRYCQRVARRRAIVNLSRARLPRRPPGAAAAAGRAAGRRGGAATSQAGGWGRSPPAGAGRAGPAPARLPAARPRCGEQAAGRRHAAAALGLRLYDLRSS